MNFEKESNIRKPQQEESSTELQTNIEQLYLKIDGHLSARPRRNEEAMELIELLPDSEEKDDRTAWVGRNFVEAGELEKAKVLVRRLKQQDEFSPYAGAVIELLRAEGDNEF